jgi:glycosyltransferase involved in cell wall biosynthesis
MAARIVIVTTYFRPVLGGVESNAERLARYLADGGCTVRLLTKRIGPELSDLENGGRFVVQRIGPFGRRSPAGKWRLAPYVTAWLVRHRATYDVVSCIDYRATGLAALAARAITGRPVVLQAQTAGVISGDNADASLQRWGVGAGGRLGRVLKRVIGTLYGRADAIACIGRALEREALNAGVPRERVHYLPNAIDMARFRPPLSAEERDRERAALLRRLDLPAGAILCVYAGRLSREKGVMDLMDAWRLLSSLAPRRSAALLVVGPDMEGHPGNVDPDARAFADRHGLSGSVRFMGPLADVAPILRLADIAVQPSHFEALGLSAIEALASGVPVVATSVGGLLDFIVDGENGLLAPPQDPAALASRLGALIEDASLRARLASRARPSVLEEYDERAVFGRFAALLETLAGAAASGAAA